MKTIIFIVGLLNSPICQAPNYVVTHQVGAASYGRTANGDLVTILKGGIIVKDIYYPN